MTLRSRLFALSLVACGCASAAPAASDETIDPDAGSAGAGGDGAGVGGDSGTGGSAAGGNGDGGAAGFPSSAGGKSAAGGGSPGAGGATPGVGGAPTGAGGAAAGPGGATGKGGGSSGAGGSSAMGGAGGTAGAGASTSACATATDSCSAPTSLGMVSGDTGGSSVMGSGKASTWFRVRVTEDDNSLFGVKLRLKIVLSAPATSNYDLYAYVDTAADVPSCTSPNAQSTSPSGNETVSLKWGESSVANGADDSRWVSVEVRWVSGGCDPFTLVATGNQ